MFYALRTKKRVMYTWVSKKKKKRICRMCASASGVAGIPPRDIYIYTSLPMYIPFTYIGNKKKSFGLPPPCTTSLPGDTYRGQTPVTLAHLRRVKVYSYTTEGSVACKRRITPKKKKNYIYVNIYNIYMAQMG